jgi:ketosteroid isomerase-like protein
VKQAKREEAAEQRAEAEIQTIEAPTTTNLEELQAALEGNPAFYEALYDAEFKRASGPRKSALRLFLVFEMEHEDREDRKADIEKALNPKG